eukprot:6201526-Pleurochrysis_carterae.AAC.2
MQAQCNRLSSGKRLDSGDIRFCYISAERVSFAEPLAASLCPRMTRMFMVMCERATVLIAIAWVHSLVDITSVVVAKLTAYNINYKSYNLQRMYRL